RLVAAIARLRNAVELERAGRRAAALVQGCDEPALGRHLLRPFRVRHSGCPRLMLKRLLPHRQQTPKSSSRPADPLRQTSGGSADWTAANRLNEGRRSCNWE